jgi:hypothetical protein
VLVRGSCYGGWFSQPGPLHRCGTLRRTDRDDSAARLLGSDAQGRGRFEESMFANAAVAHLGFGPSGPYLAAPLEVSAPG